MEGRKTERTTRSHFSPLCFVQLPCAVTSGNLVPGAKVIHGSLLVKPSERHFVIRERATGVQQRKDEEQAPTSTCNAGGPAGGLAKNDGKEDHVESARKSVAYTK